jgi:GNAT superfamily N-acetyltransferase
MSAPCLDDVVVHPLTRADAARAVDTIFAALSPQSRYLRFHSPVPRLVSTLRTRLIDVDGTLQAAVVAEVRCGADVVPVGIARLAGAGHGTADIAIAVADARQRRGIGRRLLGALGELAVEIGYDRLRGSVLPGNVAMMNLARSLFPLARREYDGETIELLIPLNGKITEEDVLAELLSRSS